MYSEDSPLPIWRSLLFVPANNERFISKAHTRGADAIVLDLEDSVPPSQKEFARQLIANSIDCVSQSGAAVMVRINESLRMAVRDLEAVVVPGVRAVVASIADYSDLEKLSAIIAQARQLGFCGAFAVHPSQVTVMNEGYLPTQQEIELAKRIETEFAASVARGQGAFAIDGKMVDKPVLDRALQQLDLVRRFTRGETD